MDAKIGRPMGLAGGLIEEVNSPIYATSVGLVLHALKADGTNNQQFDPSGAKTSGVGEVIGNITERMKSWFKEL
jgi:cell division protein FtsA